jgi:putative peptide zinc metalloprotease protein
VIIAGFSTLLVNANPLMRFDGYHVLADLIEIPNLSKRGNAWWDELIRTRILGTRERDRMPVTPWERLWFVVYPPAAFVYRIAITLSIALFVAGTYRAIGIALAAWSIAITLVWPAAKTLSALWTDHRIVQAGGRAWIGGAVAACVVLFVLFVPSPHRVIGQGVVWLPPEATVRARNAGRISTIHVANGERVEAGTLLFQLAAPEMEAEYAARRSRLARLRARLAAARFDDRAKTRDLEATVVAAERAAADMRTRIAELAIRAGVAGTVDVPALGDSRGRFLREGEVAGHVLPQGQRIVRVLVRQEDIDLVRSHLERVDIQFAHRLSAVLRGRIVREVPGGTRDLPSPVFSLEGGGPFATVDSDDGTPQALERLFQFDIAFDGAGTAPAPFGMRVFVRFDLEPMPVAYQVARAVRSTFLSLFRS